MVAEEKAGPGRGRGRGDFPVLATTACPCPWGSVAAQWVRRGQGHPTSCPNTDASRKLLAPRPDSNGFTLAHL